MREMTIAQVRRELGVPYNTIKYRVRRNLIRFRRTPFGVLIPYREVQRYRRERQRRGLR